jgi:hypothetical protein
MLYSGDTIMIPADTEALILQNEQDASLVSTAGAPCDAQTKQGMWWRWRWRRAATTARRVGATSTRPSGTCAPCSCCSSTPLAPRFTTCLNFTAVVRHGSLRCAWGSPLEAAQSLTVPLPACLLDLSLPARCWTRHDHVEVRLGLLSLDPALHMLSMSLEDERSDSDACDREHSKPFSVDFGKRVEFQAGLKIHMPDECVVN